MKKFTDILKEVNKTYQTIKETEEKTKELQSTYLTIVDLKERHEKRKTVENELVRLEEKKKDLQITIKILNSNAKIALYSETLPIVLEVLAKYKNKPYGPKTEEKILEKTFEILFHACIELNHQKTFPATEKTFLFSHNKHSSQTHLHHHAHCIQKLFQPS